LHPTLTYQHQLIDNVWYPTGLRYRKVKCVRDTDKIEVSEQRCENQPKPQTEAERCNPFCTLKYVQVGSVPLVYWNMLMYALVDRFFYLPKMTINVFLILILHLYKAFQVSIALHSLFNSLLILIIYIFMLSFCFTTVGRCTAALAPPTVVQEWPDRTSRVH